MTKYVCPLTDWMNSLKVKSSENSNNINIICNKNSLVFFFFFNSNRIYFKIQNSSKKLERAQDYRQFTIDSGYLKKTKPQASCFHRMFGEALCIKTCVVPERMAATHVSNSTTFSFRSFITFVQGQMMQIYQLMVLGLNCPDNTYCFGWPPEF